MKKKKRKRLLRRCVRRCVVVAVACFRNNEYSRIQTGGAKDTQGFSGSDNLFLVGLKIPKGSPVRVVFVTCHDKRYSLSVLLPLMIKPPDLWVESWKVRVGSKLEEHVNGGYSYNATHAGPSR